MRVVVNGDAMEIATGTSVDELLGQLGLGGKWVLVERNGEPVARKELRTTTLQPDDVVELVRAVAGG